MKGISSINRKIIKQCAPRKAPVFITGPSGSGKELVAKELHDLSHVDADKFVTINCAAIPSDLIETELFGYVKDAFMGATHTRNGAITLADKGTLFVDQIDELNIWLQAKFLRFIQTGTYTRVGSDEPETVDVRIISATNREPEIAIAEKRLREDLYYRLNVLPIDLPPLHKRCDDVVDISESFLQKYNDIEDRHFDGFTPTAKKLLCHYEWPGNVRQLKNLIYSAVVVSVEPTINEQTIATLLKIPAERLALLLAKPEGKFCQKKHSEDSSTYNLEQSIPVNTSAEIMDMNLKFKNEDKAMDHDESKTKIFSLASVERSTIEYAIKCCNDNVKQAAEALGVSPSTLYRKIQQWQREVAVK